MKYYSTKTFGNELGLSCCFRQWKASSHCSLLHGYSIGVKFVFESEELDEKGWVYDFGGFKEIKTWLIEMFDHKTIIAKDDPELETFKELNSKKIINLKIVDSVGCEKFAEMIYNHVANIDSRLFSVEVFEHGSNSAIYSR